MTSVKKQCALLLGLALYLFLLGNWNIAITDPVESNYALTAKEMLMAQNYLSPQIYGNYWYDKPIFFYWEVIAGFKLFGINEWGARFFPAMFGVLGLFMTYWFGYKLYNRRTGFVAALILGTSFEYWLIAKTVITDMTLFVFFNAALICFYVGYSHRQRNYYYGSYFFAALAVLTKGPIGLLLPGLIVILFLISQRNYKELLRMKWLGGTALFLLVAGPWYYFMYKTHGMDFINVFLGVHNVLRATVSEHPRDNVWYYYLGMFIIGFFPWVFTVPAMLKRYWQDRRAQLEVKSFWQRWGTFDATTAFLLIWALTIAVFYQLMATKYTTYTFPYLLPIAVLVARSLALRFTFVKRLVMGNVILYTILTFAVAIPYCANYSAKEVGHVVAQQVTAQDMVVSYGNYKTSANYYSGQLVYRIAKGEDIPGMKPSAMDWNNKNVMPLFAAEEVVEEPSVLAIVENRRMADFQQDVGGHWTTVERLPNYTVLRKQ